MLSVVLWLWCCVGWLCCVCYDGVCWCGKSCWIFMWLCGGSGCVWSCDVFVGIVLWLFLGCGSSWWGWIVSCGVFCSWYWLLLLCWCVGWFFLGWSLMCWFWSLVMVLDGRSGSVVLVFCSMFVLVFICLGFWCCCWLLVFWSCCSWVWWVNWVWFVLFLVVCCSRLGGLIWMVVFLVDLVVVCWCGVFIFFVIVFWWIWSCWLVGLLGLWFVLGIVVLVLFSLFSLGRNWMVVWLIKWLICRWVGLVW